MLGKTATSALEQPASAMLIDDLSPGKEEAWEKEQEDWEMLTLASSHRTSPRTQETNEAEASIPEQIEGFHVGTSSPRLPSSSRSSRASPHWRGEEITWERRGDGGTTWERKGCVDNLGTPPPCLCTFPSSTSPAAAALPGRARPPRRRCPSWPGRGRPARTPRAATVPSPYAAALAAAVARPGILSQIRRGSDHLRLYVRPIRCRRHFL